MIRTGALPLMQRFVPFSAGSGLSVPFALRDMEESAATAGEGG